MNIDLTELIIANTSCISIDDDVVISEYYFKDTSIRDLIGTHFCGDITRIGESYRLKGRLNGVMILPDDVTLEDVEYGFDINILEDFDDNSDIFKIVRNNLDITDFLWQNILVEVPLKVKSPKNEGLTLKGNGWRLISEDEIVKENNSPLSELSKMFDSRKE